MAEVRAAVRPGVELDQTGMKQPGAGRRRSVVTAVVVVVGLLLALTGCHDAEQGSDAEATPSVAPLADINVLEDPKSFVGPSTATLARRDITPVATDPEQKLPVTVTSHDQSGPREVTVTDTSRVVPLDLSGSIAATQWGLGLGSKQVGRDASTTFPGAVDLPLVTSGGHTVNSEAIIGLRPTLVITDGTVGPRDVVEQLRDVGIPVVFVKNEASYEGAAELAKQVGAVLGVPEVGEQLAQKITDDVAQTRASIDEIAPSEPDKKLRIIFLYLRGSAGVYYLFGSESGADELITALDGVDVAGELGWGGMKPLTDEAMVQADPDVILVMTKGLESVGGPEGLKQTKPAIALTKAGKNDRFVDMADGDILSFGPRSAPVLDALARALYAPTTDDAAAQ